MTEQRWIQVFENYEEKLTKEELRRGFHFCREFDGLLVGPTMGEWENCECITLAGRRRAERRCVEAGFKLAPMRYRKRAEERDNRPLPLP